MTDNSDQRKRDKERQLQVFREEIGERLSDLEESLLELENRTDDQDLIGKAFRSLHTIKGSGAMFGYDQVSQFTHNIESVFEAVRDGGIQITSQLIALSLSAHDQLVKMLNDSSDDEMGDILKREEISTKFADIINSIRPEEALNADRNVLIGDEDNVDYIQEEGSLTSYRIQFEPNPGIFANGTNPILILNELEDLGECRISAKTNNIPSFDEIDPEKCYTHWEVILVCYAPKSVVEDVFIFVDMDSKVSVEVLGGEHDLLDDKPVKRLGEILMDRGQVRKEQLDSVLTTSTRIGQSLTEAGITDRAQVEIALAEQDAMRRIQEQKRKNATVSSIKVGAEKLDRLVDLVGELVTGQARLSQIANEKNDPVLVSVAEEIERLTVELRDNAMSVRLLNFENIFKRLKRLVRDLGVETHKKVRLVVQGADTELDKTVIDQLNDPLVHILRNSVDHGIEDPATRIEAGKPAEGTISLSADYEGDHVVIFIKDDGAGMSLAKIRQKAISKELITSDAKLSDKETLALVFEPGFSTAEAVTNVSGRGVGMDIVKKSIESLRGRVELDSQTGVGTNLKIYLPLTLAIIDGLLVVVGNERFIVPLSVVEECVELTVADLNQFHGRHLIEVRGQVIPYIRVKDQFKIQAESKDIEQVVITFINGQRVGFVVDKVEGQHQTVIKHLSKIYKNVNTVSGASIMADGSVALILDVVQLAKIVEHSEHGAFEIS